MKNVIELLKKHLRHRNFSTKTQDDGLKKISRQKPEQTKSHAQRLETLNAANNVLQKHEQDSRSSSACLIKESSKKIILLRNRPVWLVQEEQKLPQEG